MQAARTTVIVSGAMSSDAADVPACDLGFTA
jgi:hypothetical protein